MLYAATAATYLTFRECTIVIYMKFAFFIVFDIVAMNIKHTNLVLSLTK